MMIMNGINIYPAEIEQVLNAHPDVRDAAAMPVHHPVHQDVPLCAVALNPGARTSEVDLLEWARVRLGPRGPRRVLVLDSIPRNHDGKLVCAELREQIVRRLTRP
jgi:acyl-CoA synthetase (AMP-forming)/AMP-acid ligase II